MGDNRKLDFWAQLGDPRTPRFASKSNLHDPINVVAWEILRLLSVEPFEVKILDIGFGKGAHWRGVELPNHVTITAVDSSSEWTSAATTPSPTNTLIGEAPAVLTSVPDASYDIVLAFDVIEHLPKHEGYKLLYEMERISRTLAIIYTPNGLVWQPPSRDNPANAHISGWAPREFRAFGWRELRGYVGPKQLWGPFAEPRFPPLKRGIRAFNLLCGLSMGFSDTAFAFTAAYRPGTNGNSHHNLS